MRENDQIRPSDHFYLKHEKHVNVCLQALREIILTYDDAIVPSWKYGMPFFCVGEKMICYLWVHKKQELPYVGFVDGNKMEHPKLIQEGRARMKILFIDPEKDLPKKEINGLLKLAIKLAKER
jgi:hypothetical protein